MLISPAIYTLFMQPASVSIATSDGDLIEIRSPADAILIPIYASITTTDEETSQQVEVIFSTRATAGSGGSSITPQPGHSHLIASQSTCLVRNTVDASGAERQIWWGGANLLGAGWEWNGDGSTIVPVSTSLVLRLGSALSVVSIIGAVVKWAEIGQ